MPKIAGEISIGSIASMRQSDFDRHAIIQKKIRRTLKQAKAGDKNAIERAKKTICKVGNNTAAASAALKKRWAKTPRVSPETKKLQAVRNKIIGLRSELSRAGHIRECNTMIRWLDEIINAS